MTDMMIKTEKDSGKNKKGIVIASAAVIIVAVIIAIVILGNAKKGYSNIRISEISGQVIAGSGDKEYSAYAGMDLTDGYSLTTKEESYSRLVLDEEIYVKLGEESRAVFTHTGPANLKNNSVSLEYGTLVTELTKSLLEEESHIVNTPNSIIAVYGTFFRVDADASGTDVYTYGGVVECRKRLPDDTPDETAVTVNAGYKCHVDDNGISDPEPIVMDDIADDDLVALYDAALHGHELFWNSDELWEEIANRGLDINHYASVYDGTAIPSGKEGVDLDETVSEDQEEITEEEELFDDIAVSDNSISDNEANEEEGSNTPEDSEEEEADTENAENNAETTNTADTTGAANNTVPPANASADDSSLRTVASLYDVPIAGIITAGDDSAFQATVAQLWTGNVEKVRYTCNGITFRIYNISVQDDRSEYSDRYWFLAPQGRKFSDGYYYSNFISEQSLINYEQYGRTIYEAMIDTGNGTPAFDDGPTAPLDAPGHWYNGYCMNQFYDMGEYFFFMERRNGIMQDNSAAKATLQQRYPDRQIAHWNSYADDMPPDMLGPIYVIAAMPGETTYDHFSDIQVIWK